MLNRVASLKTQRGLVPLLAYMLHTESLLAVLTLAFCSTLLEWLGDLPWGWQALFFGAARGLPVIFFYLAMRKATTGSLRLPRWRDFHDRWDTLIFPLVQLAILGTSFTLLFVAHLLHSVGWRSFVERYQCRPLAVLRRTEPQSVALLFTAYGLIPTGLIAAVMSHASLRLLDPSYGWRFVWRVPGPFAVLSATLGALTLLLFAADTAGLWLERRMPIPFVSSVVRNATAQAVLLAQALLIGRFVLQFSVAMSAPPASTEAPSA